MAKKYVDAKRPEEWEAKLLVGNVRVVEDDVQVCFEYIGEGLGGDFVDVDEKDVPLLRFDARDEIAALRDGLGEHDGFESYCTLVAAWTPRSEVEALARRMARDLAAHRVDLRGRCEELSWVGDKRVAVGVGDDVEMV